MECQPLLYAGLKACVGAANDLVNKNVPLVQSNHSLCFVIWHFYLPRRDQPDG